MLTVFQLKDDNELDQPGAHGAGGRGADKHGWAYVVGYELAIEEVG